MKTLAAALFLALAAAPPPATAGPVEAFDWMATFTVAGANCPGQNFNREGIRIVSMTIGGKLGWSLEKVTAEMYRSIVANQDLYDEQPETFCLIAKIGVGMLGEDKLRRLDILY